MGEGISGGCSAVMGEICGERSAGVGGEAKRKNNSVVLVQDFNVLGQDFNDLCVLGRYLGDFAVLGYDFVDLQFRDRILLILVFVGLDPADQAVRSKLQLAKLRSC